MKMKYSIEFESDLRMDRSDQSEEYRDKSTIKSAFHPFTLYISSHLSHISSDTHIFLPLLKHNTIHIINFSSHHLSFFILFSFITFLLFSFYINFSHSVFNITRKTPSFPISQFLKSSLLSSHIPHNSHSSITDPLTNI